MNSHPQGPSAQVEFEEAEIVVQQPSDLEFTKLDQLPNTHSWPTIGEEPTVVEPSDHDTVPIIDISDPNAVNAIGRACEEWGAFLVVGHGVPVSLLEEVEVQISKLFALPNEKKMLTARSPGQVSGYGLARMASFLPKMLWSEGFTFNGSPFDLALKLFPGNATHFCEVMEGFATAMEGLCAKLMQMVLQYLDLNENDLEWANPKTKFPWAVQLNSYPPCPEPDHAIGLAAHTDTSLVTVLYQSSNVGGLQVLRLADEYGPARWITVPPVNGAIVANIGDLAHIVSNGKLHSVLHRACVNSNKPRYSCAYFCGPPANITVAPAAKIIGEGEKPKFRAVSWSEYLGLKGKVFDKALDYVKLNYEDEEGDEQKKNNCNNGSSVISCA